MTADGGLFRVILRNDLRLWWRGTAGRKAAWASSTAGRLAILALLHLVMWGALAPFGGGGRGGPEFLCLVVLSLLAMTALHRSLEVLYNRGDLALLLSSPVPPRIVLQTRLADIAATTLFDSMMIVVPIIDVAVLTIDARWAFGYVAWFATTLAIVPAAVLVTVTTVERIGARRARTTLQALGILLGLASFVATQLPQWLRMGGNRPRNGASPTMPPEFFSWFEMPPLHQLAEAAAGAWQWLAPLVALGGGLFFAAQRTLALRFTHGAQGAADDVGGSTHGGKAPGTVWRGAFTRSRTRTLARTQLLLLRRDPLLLMRCAMQIVSFVPMLVGAFLVKPAAGIGGVALMAAALVPLQLAAMRNANDDAHQFEAASPLAPRQRVWIRAFGAAMPALALAAILATVVVALGAPLQAAMVVVAAPVNGLAAGWLATCTTRVHTAEERARNLGPRIGWQVVVGIFVALLGTASIGLTLTQYWIVGWILFAVALGVASLQFLAQPPAHTSEA